MPADLTVVALSKQSNSLTTACGWTYLAARALYVPSYAFGLTPWRSAIWGVGFLATCVMIAANLI